MKLGKLLWIVSLVLAGGLILFLPGSIRFEASQVTWDMALVLAGLAFLGEYVDSSLGMGYGTTLTPVLLLMGFAPREVVPAVLLSELVTGLAAAGAHVAAGNVRIDAASGNRRVVLLLGGCSVGGTIAAVILALRLPPTFVKLYIGIMIVAVGLLILLCRRGAEGGISLSRLLALGCVAAFNKGISGGGYGPLLTGGQILSGVREKTAIAVTSFAEGLVCCVGFGAYCLLEGAPSWPLAGSLVTGALLSVPLAAWTVRLLPDGFLRRSVGVCTLFLGVVMLTRLL